MGVRAVSRSIGCVIKYLEQEEQYLHFPALHSSNGLGKRRAHGAYSYMAVETQRSVLGIGHIKERLNKSARVKSTPKELDRFRRISRISEQIEKLENDNLTTTSVNNATAANKEKDENLSLPV